MCETKIKIKGKEIKKGNVETMEMGKTRKRRKQRKRKHQRRRQKAAATAAVAAAAEAETATTAEAATVGEIWSSTYKSLVEWHRQQVMSFCRGTVQEQEEESSSSQEEEEELEENPLQTDGMEEDVDADYLSFLEVTLKHQQELKQLRAEGLATLTIPTTEN